MANMDVSLQRQSLLGDATTLGHLPSELLHIIEDQSATNILDAIARVALIPRLTGRIFAHFESVFADVCARWALNSQLEIEGDLVIASFARILPFAPSLSVFLDKYLENRARNEGIPRPDRPNLLNFKQVTSPSHSGSLLKSLLAVWRLISFDKRAYARLVQPEDIQELFEHQIGPVKYVAIRIFCQLLSASDHKLESLIAQYISGDEALNGDFDGEDVDYTFLTLFEHARVGNIRDQCERIRETLQSQSTADISGVSQSLTPLVARYGNALLPRPSGPPTLSSSLVLTPTTVSNLESLAKLLLQPGPVLLHGLPGAGKTSLVQETARELGMNSDLVTLHLNEQTDAKMLIGLYTTGVKPGSFEWRPGVLTTAVKEGRWVLIEDIDRAPNEVMSTLLPLIERGELLIANRGERIKAASGFRILATVRTSIGMNGQKNLPSLLGLRFWQLLSVQPLPEVELRDVIAQTYPRLHKFVPEILAVFDRVCALLRTPRLLSGASTALERPINSRDLFKWCRRLDRVLLSAGSTKGDEPISETTLDSMFMEAVDCFVGSVKDSNVRDILTIKIGELMGRSEQRVQHHLSSHIPQLEDKEKRLAIGRVTLHKTKQYDRLVKSKRPFATTSHAKRLLEQIAVAVDLKEPILLVGETGIGKTTVVQQLAETLGHKMIAVNLSQQSEVGDLLGGFKPINVRSLAVPLKEEFEDLFATTGISAERNKKYLDQIGKRMAKGKWTEVSKLWRQAPKMFDQILEKLAESELQAKEREDGQPAKRRKTGASRLQTLRELKPRWEKFTQSLEQFEIQASGGSNSFAFAFVEGNMVKAARNGDWVLLDEINLASPDTLESIADLLQSGPNASPSILLSETGEIERIHAHPDFRIFGAMNPATDVGKRDLPIGLRSRFTELYVSSPDRDVKDLVVIIKTYLKGNSSTIDKAADNVANLYLQIKALAESKALVDGANEVPHFSLRTLTRVLTYVNDVAPFYGLERALYEGFCMGFMTLLSQDSEKLVAPLILDTLFGKNPNRRRSLLSQPLKPHNDGRQYIRFMNKDYDRQYWLLQGDQKPQERNDYIRTQYVERNLLNLVRATSTRRFPILIQGPTSSGKTSMIEYLANYSGNKFVRINNHEHTDLQEYLGTYVSGSDGKLKFQEGLLVQAMRQGHWIVLDELNLAPTDVLEALNRLLDDNRELLIPETQEIVRPHESFMLFATQNPPGLYGGRKVLSRAFRNRFLELHYDDIPEDELEYILQKRSLETAPSDCKRIVTVYKELSRLRQTSRVFEQKDSFATLRDLFRWALRKADNREQIATNGFMLLAERVRNEEERIAVKEVIETVFKVKIEPDRLYSPSFGPLAQFERKQNSQGVVWTRAMRRLYVLVAQALRNNEPVLLVGETGCGKTTVCQLLAESIGKELHIVNAHQNTETGDLIGSQRPVRNRGAILEALRQDLVSTCQQLRLSTDGSVEELLERFHSLPDEASAQIPDTAKERITINEVRSKALFEWSDGSLVHAMKTGQFFLLDEISLADDSVLERLNSVLEPQRTLLLAEKGIDDSFVKATHGFQFFATMNPGGDFGKKELSPALRNRFTEIWVPPMTESQDVLDIVVDKLKSELSSLATFIVDFSYWFGKTFRSSSATAFSIRDILVWVTFMNESSTLSPGLALLHGAATVFIDTLGANPSALMALDPKTMNEQRQLCLDKLSSLMGDKVDVTPMYRNQPNIYFQDDMLSIGEFNIARNITSDSEPGFAFEAPTTKMNAMRVLRALRVNKPILLEGNPGVGKTTLVSALAKTCGRPLTRINLSDQTDLMDLFGTDVPVEGAEAGNFAWRDAPFLQAMQKGEWVLLDEMNLASQSVLEGLNACLDHRGEVYISELDQVFKRHPDFRLFAAQNPHHQGGGRKGLPSSFVNRFIVVYADVFTVEDLMLIANKRYRTIPELTIQHMIKFIAKLDHEVVIQRSFGSHGSPWEFNLRDTLRWLELLSSSDTLLASGTAADFLDIVIRQRFRSATDRQVVDTIFSEAFQTSSEGHNLYHNFNSGVVQVGLSLMFRNMLSQPTPFPNIDEVPRLNEVESLMICVKQDLPCILVGSSGSGKSILLQHLAALAGKNLVIFPLNADIDTMDLVGGFEQSDPLREIHACLDEVRTALQDYILSAVPKQVSRRALTLLTRLDKFSEPDHSDISLKIQDLGTEVSAASQLGQLLERAYHLLQQPTTLADPRFEWLDGVIVRAMEAGQWLVLDNANLCSASVLDRLNSLLERPNGFLSINEHSGADGEPRVIKPHRDFRIFLTMDPRYGELSRAMRNRSIEIFVDAIQPTTPSEYTHLAAVESSMQRYYAATLVLDKAGPDLNDDLCKLALDNLSLADSTMLSKYRRALEGGLLVQHTSNLNLYCQHVEILQEFVQSPSATRQGILHLYETATSSIQISATVESKSLTPFSTFLTRMQPIYPLNNSPLVALGGTGNLTVATWLALSYDFFLDVQAGRLAGLFQERHADRSRPSSLNRFQRSCISGQVATVAKDSTVQVSRFLSSTLQDLDAFFQGDAREAMDVPLEDSQAMVANSSPNVRSFMRAFMHYWWRTFKFVTDKTFDEAKFQAHLRQGIDFFTSTMPTVGQGRVQKLRQSIIQSIQTDFVTGFKLSTGLSMESLWEHLRPAPIHDENMLRLMQIVERLAEQLDNIKWRSNASLSDLARVVSYLSKAYNDIFTGVVDVKELLETLTSNIHSLESKLQDSQQLSPFFAAEFEMLRQSLALYQISHQRTSFVGSSESLLSNLPTIMEMRIRNRGASDTISFIDYIMCQDSAIHPWAGTQSASLIRKFDSIGAASLFSLRSIEMEIPHMGKTLATASEAITVDTITALNGLLLDLVKDIASHTSQEAEATVSSYECECKKVASSDIQINDKGFVVNVSSSQVEPQDLNLDHAAEIMKAHFFPVLLALESSEKPGSNRMVLAAISWVQFAIGCIKLYVPDKVFDPYLRAQTEREFHEGLRELLQKKLEAVHGFEQIFTGQKSNSRIVVLEAEIGELPQLPPTAEVIYRPSNVELNRLQGEFNNVLNAVLRNDVSSMHFRYVSKPSTSGAQELQLVKDNVAQLIARLSSRFPAYQDLTVPLINFLRCLQVGLSLTDNIPQSRPEDIAPSFLEITPFLGGNLSIVDKSLPARELEALSVIGSLASIDGMHRLESHVRVSLFESLHFFYNEWSKKLDIDRKNEAAKSSLYQFRGSLEDEEEVDAAEFEQLFPNYEANEGDQERGNRKHVVRDISVRLADLHRNIFVSPQECQASLQALCKLVGRKLSKNMQTVSEFQADMDKALLPAAFLVLEEKVSDFDSDSSSKTNNFYTDANLSEARKVVKIVNAIQARFKELQSIDEISMLQTITDVIMACDHILELSHTEPLAKIIIRVEKLHQFVDEWESGHLAARQYGIPALYKELVSTIVDWRRLELATWKRLFDMETKNCEDDAKSWWFVAYQAVIAIPMSKLESREPLRDYATQLVSDLDMFFSTAILGQYQTRLQLLKQLRAQLELLVMDYPSLDVIQNALQNFISFYGRYEVKVTETIQKGRASLDKKMNDVLLLASWKDTNILALRESARRSHMKLFRVVRKFRGLLGQPVKSIIDQGLPDEKYHTGVDNHQIRGSWFEPVNNASSVALCQQLIPQWGEDSHSKRLSNGNRIVEIMAKTSRLPGSAVEAAEVVNTWLSDLAASMAALRKETPPFLADDNKEIIKHLKNRKMRLFEETLKAVRQMGFTRNLSENLQKSQNNLSIIFARLNPLHAAGDDSIAEIDYYFHKVLDLAPRFRQSLQNHSGDLSNDAVRRSTGYLEGILYVMMQQRGRLAEIQSSLSSLDAAVADVLSLTAVKSESVVKVTGKTSDHGRVLRWLTQIIAFGLHLVELQGKLGGFDNSDLRTQLQEWLTRFENLQNRMHEEAVLPDGFVSDARLKAQDQLVNDLETFRTNLETLEDARPDLAFVIQQIRLWTTMSEESDQNGAESAGIAAFTDELLTLSKKILNAVQKLQDATSSLPTSIEDASWLLKYSSSLSNALSALHANTVAGGIKSSLSQLRTLDLSAFTNKRAAFALLGVMLPIFQQYTNICHDTVGKFVGLHRSTSMMAYNLSKLFTQLASEGFCTPQEKSDETSGDSGKLESGTGLGEGEGADDISKDIQPDEDLSELAQEPDKERDGEIEDEKDAVDMANEEMEGQMGDAGGEEEDDKSSKSGDENEDDEMDEEVGDVDDLDPTAVDEKMWDGDGEDADKDQQGDQEKGQKKDDEQMAADEVDDKKGEKPEEMNEPGEPEMDEELGPEQDEALPQDELNRQDQNVQENETLALPDEMEIDKDQDSSSSVDNDDLDALSENQDDTEEQTAKEPDSESVGDGDDLPETNQEVMDEDNEEGEAPPEGEELPVGDDNVDMEVDEEDGSEAAKDQDQVKQEPVDNAQADQNAAPSDVKSGAGQEQDTIEEGANEQESQNKASQRDRGEMGQNAEDQETAAGDEGSMSRLDQDPSQNGENKPSETSESQPFKQLGDAMERWYRNQQDIKNATEDENRPPIQDKSEAEMAKQEFQHLQNEDSAADAQALGTATEEEVRPIDDSMAIDEETRDSESRLLPDSIDEEETKPDQDMDEKEPTGLDEKETPLQEDTRSGVATRQGAFNQDRSMSPEETVPAEKEDERIQETSTQLSSTHITERDRSLRDYSESLEQWTSFQTKTHPLSLALTSQLRLILTPSQSTKLSGSYRTGKRLNIKKIIPYIASSYKRDKIWMRRSIPTKRAYQILLCVDDSRSMGETTSGGLALESLVMVSRSLAMLEAGQVGVLGFGADVFTAHDLTEPFASHDAGARVLQKFSFEQDRTDICLLVRQTIDQFRAARLQGGRGSEDLWQLALILSDGLTPSSAHDKIRRLLREAMEERIMIVFIIMDDSAKKKGDSVLELKEAKFVKDEYGQSNVVIERYLDTFPFQYYLIVHNLEDLPGALAGLLRTWFAEVNS